MATLSKKEKAHLASLINSLQVSEYFKTKYRDSKRWQDRELETVREIYDTYGIELIGLKKD